VLIGKFIPQQNRQPVSKKKNQRHLQLLEKQNQLKPQTSSWKEIIKIMVEVNKMGTKKAIHRINETKSWFFEKINKIGKP
jgi:hypothetical protein